MTDTWTPEVKSADWYTEVSGGPTLGPFFSMHEAYTAAKRLMTGNPGINTELKYYPELLDLSDLVAPVPRK